MSIDANTSIEALRSATVTSSDGSKIGRVGDVYLGDGSGQPEWVTVKTGLFGSAETFVPLAAASYQGDEIRVPYSKDQVKDAPRTDADGQITEAEEGRLFEHYGIADTGSGAAGEGYADGSGQTRGDYQGLDDLGAATGDAGPAAAGTRSGADDPRRDRGGDPRRDLAGEPGVEGRDTSGPTTDDAMTRSEERLQVGTQRREAGRARLRKHIVTETQTAQVGTSRDELTVSREPITEANRGAATSGAELSEEEHEVVLHEEVPVVSKTVEAVERVRLGTEAQHETQSVSADVRKEQIDLDRDGTTDATTAGAFDVDAERARATTDRDRA